MRVLLQDHRAISQVTQCGGEAIRLDLEWVTSARDFHNNWSHFGTARLIFFKWSS